MGLTEYRRNRDFRVTTELRGSRTAQHVEMRMRRADV
jgi:hypothetical protein